MSTRKSTAKKAIKKAVAKKATKVSRPVPAQPEPVAEPIVVTPPAPEPVPHVVTVVPVMETFRTTPEPATTRTVPEGRVLVFINGHNRGEKVHHDMTMGEYARKLAQNAGIRTFSVYVDDQKANTTMAELPMGQFGKIEIVAKDSRGGR